MSFIRNYLGEKLRGLLSGETKPAVRSTTASHGFGRPDPRSAAPSRPAAPTRPAAAKLSQPPAPPRPTVVRPASASPAAGAWRDTPCALHLVGGGVGGGHVTTRSDVLYGQVEAADRPIPAGNYAVHGFCQNGRTMTRISLVSASTFAFVIEPASARRTDVIDVERPVTPGLAKFPSTFARLALGSAGFSALASAVHDAKSGGRPLYFDVRDWNENEQPVAQTSYDDNYQPSFDSGYQPSFDPGYVPSDGPFQGGGGSSGGAGASGSWTNDVVEAAAVAGLAVAAVETARSFVEPAAPAADPAPEPARYEAPSAPYSPQVDDTPDTSSSHDAADDSSLDSPSDSSGD